MALTLKERIAREANELGFAAVRFASADPPPGAGAALEDFLAHGRHGDMAWLADNKERRKSPRAIWPEVKSIIMLGLSYGPERDPLQALGMRSRGAISVYAQGADYHDVIKSKLKALAARVQDVAPGEVKVFVDTAPVMEKPIAAKAGLGWQGKHTNLVSRDFGSWLFLGSIFTTAEIDSRSAGRGSLRRLPTLPRRVPDTRVRRALSARCAGLHLLPHHRAQGAYRDRVPRGHGQPNLRLRRLSRRVPVEQIREGRARGKARRAGRERQSSSFRVVAARRCGLSRPLQRHADQTHRARPVLAQCADRRRQFRG